MTLQESYRKGFVDGRKFLVQYATEDGWPAMLVNVAKGATETLPEDSKEFDPPNVCQENAKMQIRITESVWEKVKYTVESKVFEEMKRMGVFDE